MLLDTEDIPLAVIDGNEGQIEVNKRVLKKDILYRCETCGKNFKSNKASEKRTPKYCSKSCYAESLKINKPCRQCGETIDTKGGSVRNRIYCSAKCRTDSRKGTKLSLDHRNALSEGRRKSKKCKGKNLYNWKGGKETLGIRSKINQHRRRSKIKIKADKVFLFSVFNAQGKKCFYCECSLEDYKAIEHMTPICRGGDNQNYNIVYSCKSCNSRKREKTMEEYAIKTKNFHWIDKWDSVYSKALIIKDQVQCFLTSKQQS